MLIRAGWIIGIVVAGLLLAVSPASAAPGAPAAVAPTTQAAALAPGSGPAWTAVRSFRVLDTHRGYGTAPGPLAANGRITVPLRGIGGIPSSGVSAVVVSITVSEPQRDGTVTASPAGGAKGPGPTVRFTAGGEVTTQTVVRLGSTGAITLANNTTGTIHLDVDVNGYTAAGTSAGSYVPVTPKRIIDTTCRLGANGPIAGHGAVSPQIAGRAGVPRTGASAVVLTVSVLNPRGAGWLTALPGGAGTSRATGSALNWSSGVPVTGPVVVPLSAAGAITLINQSAAEIDLQVDVLGYIRAGTADIGGLVTIQSTRIADSRSGFGWPPGAGPMRANDTVSERVFAQGGIPDGGVSAVLMTVTAVSPTAAGAVRLLTYTISDDGLGAAVSFEAGQNRTGLVLVPVTSDGIVRFSHSGLGDVHLVVDVVGYVRGAPQNPPLQWSPAAATTSGLDGVTDLDCLTPAYCVGIDDAGRSATFDGASWRLVPGAGVPPMAAKVSCATPTYCMAISGQPSAVAIFDGTGWLPVALPPDNPPSPYGNWLTGVACATQTACFVIDSGSGNVWAWNGVSWSPRTELAEPSDDFPYPHLLDVSCATPTFCAIVATRAASWLFDGRSWNEANLGLDSANSDVDCPVSGFCVALNGVSGWSQDAVVYQRGVYSLENLTPDVGFTTASCADERFCVAVGGGYHNRITTWDGTAWTDPFTPQEIEGLPAVISCPTEQFCIALQRDGEQIIGRA